MTRTLRPRMVLLVSLIGSINIPASGPHAATPLSARQTIDAQGLRRHVSFLASDTLEGRAAGTPGGHAAANYLAAEFRKLGLTPAGEMDDYLQEFGRGYRNVLALLPGRDPELSKQVILLGGHFDHVGYGKPGNSFGPYGQIHNGADDNASGAAAILEVAEACAQLDQRPSRTILFAYWDAEEAGLLGSEHWVAHPTHALDQIKLVLNVDMIGRLRDDRVTVYGTRTAAGLRQIAALANQEAGMLLDFDWTQREDSDHWSFYRRRIPYLMLHTGDHEDYHRPSDDAHKLNYDGLERLARMIFELVRLTADSPVVAGFRGEAVGEGPAQQQRHEQLRPGPASPSRLGIAWDARREATEPFVITRVVTDSPADQAGLRPGDRIARFEGRTPEDIGDLVGAVLSAPDVVHLIIERDGESSPQNVAITLRGNPIRLGIHWRTDAAEPEAAIVTSVVPGSPAAQAGILPNDRLYGRVEETAQPDDWLRRLASFEESPLALQVERDGRLRETIVYPLPLWKSDALQLAD